jgi:hypothetical protein
VSTSILIFLDCTKVFHVNVNASSIALGIVLVKLGDNWVDNLIYYASKKFSNSKRNYTTMEHEGVAMVYTLHKFRHYLLGTPFKFFINNSLLKYSVNKSVLGGIICRWSLLFQEFEFEVVVKPEKHNMGPNHISRMD